MSGRNVRMQTDLPEPKLGDAIRRIHAAGWYMTFMYERRAEAEAAKDSVTLLRLFLRHITDQAVDSHAAKLLCERCKPIIDEARRRECLFFKCDVRDDTATLILTFNNGKDDQFSRYVSYRRFWEEYDRYPDASRARIEVEGFFLYQPDISYMRYGLSKTTLKAKGQPTGSRPASA